MGPSLGANHLIRREPAEILASPTVSPLGQTDRTTASIAQVGRNYRCCAASGAVELRGRSCSLRISSGGGVLGLSFTEEGPAVALSTRDAHAMATIDDDLTTHAANTALSKPARDSSKSLGAFFD